MMSIVDEKASKLSAPEHVPLDPSARIIAIQISIKDIDPNYEQPRKNFDEAALNDLAESIKMHGVIQPIVVVRMGMRFYDYRGRKKIPRRENGRTDKHTRDNKKLFPAANQGNKPLSKTFRERGSQPYRSRPRHKTADGGVQHDSGNGCGQNR